MYKLSKCVWGRLQTPRAWFKGNDTTTVCLFLENMFNKFLKDEHCDHEHKEYFAHILACLASANEFMRTLYNSSIWLTESQRTAAIASIQRILAEFTACAGYAYNVLAMTRFAYRTKYHMFAEIYYGLLKEHRSQVPSLNPLCNSTQMDEDFVGRVSTLARSVAYKTVHFKTLQRYCLSLASNW